MCGLRVRRGDERLRKVGIMVIFYYSMNGSEGVERWRQCVGCLRAGPRMRESKY